MFIDKAMDGRMKSSVGAKCFQRDWHAPTLRFSPAKRMMERFSIDILSLRDLRNCNLI
jgi:hypothetical protein